MKAAKRLYWLEYTDIGDLMPTRVFQAVGFETQHNSWNSVFPERLRERILPEIEAWRPDVIALWIHSGNIWPGGIEPPEWVMLCQYLRQHPVLHTTKLMAFIGLEASTFEQRQLWQQRYDFYTLWPMRIIEHATIARQLVGEPLQGFEGVNYTLQLDYGPWKFQNALLMEQSDQEHPRPNAEGRFSTSPVTRLLTTETATGYGWDPEPIKVQTPTSIVYIIKGAPTWRAGLSASECGRLAQLAATVSPGQQLLVGANSALLQTDASAVVQVIQQAAQAGGWRVFINEHLWFEGVLHGWGVRQVLYENKSSWGPFAI